MSQKINTSIAMNQALNLPRPVVNKILAHAQQSADNPSISISCGIISTDDHGNKFYFPVTRLVEQSRDSAGDCSNDYFSHSYTLLQPVLEQIRDKKQTVLVYVFTSPKHTDINTNTPDKNIFNLDKHYYIMNSLDTKGVLSMQGFYREGDNLLEVELALEL